MSRLTRLARPPNLPWLLQPLAGFAIGALGAAGLSGPTTQGYLHATVVTGAGYTGAAESLGPGEQLLMLVAWILVGGLAGYVGRSTPAFAGLWVGALVGSAVGFLGDPGGNILWLDLIVTVVGVSLFLTPGFFLGAAVAGWRERQEPDGSGKRPTPPPLWTRGPRRPVRREAGTTGPAHAAATVSSSQPATAAPYAPTTYPPSAYARPGSQAQE